MINYREWLIGCSIEPYMPYETLDPEDYFVVRFLSPIYAFRLSWRQSDNFVCTYYPACRWSGCTPVPDDRHHGSRLGIVPAEHHFLHELIHHLVGIFVYNHFAGSPIIYRDAHHIPQPESVIREDGSEWGEWQEEEWLVTALTYYLFGMSDQDYGASIWLRERGIDQAEILRVIRELAPMIKL